MPYSDKPLQDGSKINLLTPLHIRNSFDVKHFKTFAVSGMKSVIIAEAQGFCWGVRRALDIVNKRGAVSILGDLIHNKQVVGELEGNGKKVIQEISIEEDRPIVITAHGTNIQNIRKIKKLDKKLVDTTCPLVSAIYKAGEQLEKEGYRVLIIGDKKHVEVIGIASRMDRPIIVNSEEELELEQLPPKVGVICQSTFSLTKFENLTNLIQQRVLDVKIQNTICHPTKKRQEAAEKLATKVEVMIVIGGFHSSNTKKLVELTRQYCESYHIETANQLDFNWVKGKTEIGITAGASTADWVIQEVYDTLISW